MRISILLSFLIAIPLCLAVTQTENYKALAHLVPDLKYGTRYMFLEKWPQKNAVIKACIADFSHVRLVVGTFNKAKMDFSGRTFELITDTEQAGTSGDWYGGKTEPIVETFEAGHYWTGSGVWRNIPGGPPAFSFLGPTTKTLAVFEAEGKAYCEKYKTYNLATNNCFTFANTIAKET